MATRIGVENAYVTKKFLSFLGLFFLTWGLVDPQFFARTEAGQHGTHEGFFVTCTAENCSPVTNESHERYKAQVYAILSWLCALWAMTDNTVVLTITGAGNLLVLKFFAVFLGWMAFGTMVNNKETSFSKSYRTGYVMWMLGCILTTGAYVAAIVQAVWQTKAGIKHSLESNGYFGLHNLMRAKHVIVFLALVLMTYGAAEVEFLERESPNNGVYENFFVTCTANRCSPLTDIPHERYVAQAAFVIGYVMTLLGLTDNTLEVEVIGRVSLGVIKIGAITFMWTAWAMLDRNEDTDFERRYERGYITFTTGLALLSIGFLHAVAKLFMKK